MRLWERIKDYAKLLFFGAVAYYILHWASFTEEQALVLAAFVASGANIIGSIMRHEARERFEPFSITFHPNWFSILTEQGLIDDEAYRTIMFAEKLPGFRILREDLHVLLLSISPPLYYVQNVQAFRSRLEVYQTLTELLTPEELRDVLFKPTFYIKLTSAKHPKFEHLRFIEFGIRTRESQEKALEWSEKADIPLGRLPDAAFNPYYAGDNFPLNMNARGEAVERLLTEYGWTREKRSYDSPSTDQTLEHKYMMVTFDGI